jgi:hypothetical protein
MTRKTRMISNRDDSHAVLGVPRTASPAQISHAYRELLRRHHPDTRTPEDDDAHDLALSEVLNAYANLHGRTSPNEYDSDPPVRHAHQPRATDTQPVVVLGHVDPPGTATPAWIAPYGNGATCPTPINLLIALIEALPHDAR